MTENQHGREVPEYVAPEDSTKNNLSPRHGLSSQQWEPSKNDRFGIDGWQAKDCFKTCQLSPLNFSNFESSKMSWKNLGVLGPNTGRTGPSQKPSSFPTFPRDWDFKSGTAERCERPWSISGESYFSIGLGKEIYNHWHFYRKAVVLVLFKVKFNLNRRSWMKSIGLGEGLAYLCNVYLHSKFIYIYIY